MSFSHKAYEFDWEAFRAELAPVLNRCLADSQAQPLIDFVNRHRESVSDPYEGEPLDADWEDRLEIADVQELADYALTRYYDPTSDCGLAEAWMDLEATLDGDSRRALFGEAFGPPGHPFDPGKMGSYFQSPDAVKESAIVLQRQGTAGLRGYLRLLEAASRANKGVYVTF